MHVEDRWFRDGPPGPDGKPAKIKRPRHGTGRRWRARYIDLDGIERGPSFDTKALAERFLDEVRKAKDRGTWRDPDAGNITLRKYAGDWLEMQGFDAVTREAVESRMRIHILPALGDRRLAELAARPSIVQAWAVNLPLAPSTVRKVFTHFNSIMIAAQTDSLIDRNPCTEVWKKLPRSTQRPVEPWTPEQAAAVRRTLPGHLRTLVDAGNGLGLRQSELFGLAVEEIDFLRRIVHVHQQVKLIGGRAYFAPPKGSKVRDVPLAAQTADALAVHLAEHLPVRVTLPWHDPGDRRHGKPHTAALLFTRPDGQPQHRAAFNSHVWRPAIKAAGLAPGNGCHMMRHTFASTLISEGVDPRTVAEFLGHSDGGALVLKTYSHLMPDAQDKARRAIEKALSRKSDGPHTAQSAGEGL